MAKLAVAVDVPLEVISVSKQRFVYLILVVWHILIMCLTG